MISDDVFKNIEEQIRQSKMDDAFNNATQICIISAPAIVIEIIVKKASIDSNVPMDWHYFGGRAIVYGIGDEKQIAEAKQQIWLSLPQSNLLSP